MMPITSCAHGEAKIERLLLALACKIFSPGVRMSFGAGFCEAIGALFSRRYSDFDMSILLRKLA
jgi:hypothetical protein